MDPAQDKPPVPPTPPEPGTPPAPAITPEQFAETQAAVKRLEAANKKLAEEYSAAQKKLADAEKAKLEGSGDFQKLWETERKTREEVEAKLAETKSSFVLTQKHIAAKDALIKAGLIPDAMKMLDRETFDALDVTIANDRFEVKGTDTLVAQWKQEYPFLFKSAAQPPNVNTGGVGSTYGGGGADITADDLFKVERKFGVRSTEYKNAVIQFTQTKAKRQAANR